MVEGALAVVEVGVVGAACVAAVKGADAYALRKMGLEIVFFGEY